MWFVICLVIAGYVCLYIGVDHGVVIVSCSPWYRLSSVCIVFSSIVVSYNSVCICCIPIEKNRTISLVGLSYFVLLLWLLCEEHTKVWL